jgi:hypothetical protein
MEINGSIGAADRRQKPRVKLDQLAYINLHTGNGGIVLDVSKEGLGLQAVSPMLTQVPIRFWFAARPIEGIEASGELVWKDETGKRGGLRFTHLPHEVDEKIRTWLGQPSVPFRVARNSAPARAAEIKFAPATGARPANREAKHARRGPAGPPSVPHAPVSEPWPFFRESATIGSYGTEGAGRPAPGAAVRSRPAVMVWAVAVAMAVGTGMLSYLPKRETGGFLIHLGERLSGEFGSRSGGPAPTATRGSPAEIAAPSRTAADGAAPGGDEPPAKSALGESARSDVAPAREQSGESQAEDYGQAELALARNYLREPGSPGNTDEAARLLWSAVEKGSVAAEVDLGDLFLRGVGVQKNCEQARVLLTAANNRNNAIAGERLAELSRYGCQ